MKLRPFLSLVASLPTLYLFLSISSAQTVYGKGVPGTGGVVPTIECDQAWVGRMDFHVRVGDGLGGTTGFLLYSDAPDAVTVAGSPTFIDVNQLFATHPLTLGGDPGVSGAGSVEDPFPLALTPAVAFAGLSLYAQAFLDDSPLGIPASTPGLEIELTMPPQVAVGTFTVPDPADRLFLVDPLAGTLELDEDTVQTQTLFDGAYAESGTQLYVSSSLQNQIHQLDLTSSPPAWSTLGTFPGHVLGLRYDGPRQLLWALADLGTGPRELVAVDVDPAGSPGALVGVTVGASTFGPPESWTLSSSGTVAATIASFSNEVVLLDTDPDSSTFQMVRGTLTVPTSTGLPFPFQFHPDLEFSPDERQLLVLVQHLGEIPSEVARYDFILGQWIDHDPGTPEVDNIGPASSPPVPLGAGGRGLSVPRDAFRAGVCGTQGWSGILEFSEDDPTAFAYQEVQGATVAEAWVCELDPDGTTFAVASFAPPFVHFFDAVSAGWIHSVGLPHGTDDFSFLVWR